MKWELATGHLGHPAAMKKAAVSTEGQTEVSLEKFLFDKKINKGKIRKS